MKWKYFFVLVLKKVIFENREKKSRKLCVVFLIREVKREMKKADYRPRGVYQKKIKYFVNGVMIGSKIQIVDLKTAARKFHYKRKIYATEHSTGDYTLQNQKRI